MIKIFMENGSGKTELLIFDDLEQSNFRFPILSTIYHPEIEIVVVEPWH